MATLSSPRLQYERESSLRTTNNQDLRGVCTNQHLPMQFQHTVGETRGLEARTSSLISEEVNARAPGGG